MSGLPGSGYGPEEPQCYNCGALGHWAVACPEPTRQTPAGLAAWRNASHARPGSSDAGNRDRRGPPKKHKGPIITKYGPPPGAQPPPPIPHSQPPPPPMNAYHPSGPPYHSSAPYPHQVSPPPPAGPPGYHPYGPPTPGYAHGHPPLDYPPRHHAESRYPPTPPGPPHGPPHPPPYNYDAQHMHPYPQHQPPPPPPSRYGPSPPGYQGYSERGPEAGRFGPPPLPPPSHRSPPPPPTPHGNNRRRGSHSHTSEQPHRPPPRLNHPDDRHRGPPSQPPARRQSGSQSRKTPTTVAPIKLPTPLIHSLPPKPPQARNPEPEVQRGKHNKRNQDRKGRQRNNKQKDGNRKPSGEQKNQKSAAVDETAERPPSRRTEASPGREGTVPVRHSPSQSQPQQVSGQDSKQDQTSQGKDPEAAALPDDTTETKEDPDLSDASDDDEDTWSRDYRLIFKSPKPSHVPDEVGRPLPYAYHEEILLPRKWDAKCIASDFVTPTNLEIYCQPVHETEYWPCIEFDPAFVVAGKFPCGEPIPKHFRLGLQSQKTSKEKEKDDPLLPRESSPRKRSFSLNHGNKDHEPQRAVKRRRPSEAAKTDSYIPSYPKSPDRSRSRERRSESRGSAPRSRRSSASSLNSLEAALLGISEEPKSPPQGRSPSSPPPSDRRGDTSSRSPQIRRRRPKPQSAYSRRW